MKKLTGNFLMSCAIGGVAFLLYTVRDILSKDNNEDLLIGDLNNYEYSNNEYENMENESNDEKEEFKDIVIIDDSDIEF